MSETFEDHLHTVLTGIQDTENQRLINQALTAWAHEAFDFDLWLLWADENMEYVWEVADLAETTPAQ